jgi:hypothetical protein
MSNAALRQRLTVPLTSSHHKTPEYVDEGEHSVPTEDDGSMRSSSLSAASTAVSLIQKSDVSVSARRLEPIRKSFLNNSSGHSKESSSIKKSRRDPISTSELKRSMMAKQRNGDRAGAASSDPRTPSGRNKLFSIGKDQNPVALLPPLERHNSTGSRRASRKPKSSDTPDMLDLEQALQESGLNRTSPYTRKSDGSDTKKSVFAARTPFEVDAPRGDGPNRRRSRGSQRTRSPSPSSRSIDESEPLDKLSQHLTQEQDVWAGIDALLETQSLNDSFCYSTSDILPKATVKAMRREPKGLGDVDEETVWGDEASEAGESRQSKRSGGSISKASRSTSSSNSSRHKGQAKNSKSKIELEGHSSSFKKNQESWTSTKEEKDHIRQDAGLFDMFQWSEKDNVDEQRTRKGKLNNQARKILLFPPVNQGQQDSDTSSLPSLATFRKDDFSVHSSAHSNANSLDWDTYHSGDLGSVVTENSRDEFAFESVQGSVQEEGIPATISDDISESESHSNTSNSRNSFAGDGLVLDKGVDEYIRKIQRNLPTITEDENSPIKKGKKKQVGFAFEEGESSSSPSPTGVIPEETAFDALPSLLAGRYGADQIQKTTNKKGRKEEKKESKPALSFLMNSFNSSIRKIATKAKTQKKLGDEEKYFPDAVRTQSKSKKDGANRCLLSQGDDGVNWDGD